MKSVSIIGPNGQLGSELVKVFTFAGWKVVPIGHSEISVENAESVSAALKRSRTDWVINTAAFHKLDECEADSERAWEINTFGPFNVAGAAKLIGARCVYISSDYVFNGNKEIGSAYSEGAPVSPVNSYGHSKAAGEIATLAFDVNNLVVRVASLFGSAGSSGKGGNFVETILKKAKAGEQIMVVDDIHMSPTYAKDAAGLIEIALSSDYSGILHASNTGNATWYEFAREILNAAGVSTKLTPTQSDFLKIPIRPRNTVLSVNRAVSLNPLHSDWQNALNRYLFEKKQ